MDGEIYQGNSIEVCLGQASKQLGISVESLKYEVVEKEGFLRKKFKVKVYSPIIDNSELNGKAWVEGGKIIVKNPEQGGKPCKIFSAEGMILNINGHELQVIEAYESDEINISIDEKKAERKIDIKVSEDKMEALLSIQYFPELKYKIKDTLGGDCLNLELEEVSQEFPPLFSKDEIINCLKANNIIYGINEIGISNIDSQKKIEKLLIAKGKEIIKPIDDEIQLNFQSLIEKTINDELQAIDFREVADIEIVKPGQVLLVKIDGKDGQDGIDIYGKKISAGKAKRVNLRAGKGCSIKENTIVADISGNPSYVGNVVTVNEIHNVNGDVDLSTGNIHFAGKVHVSGNITQGMKVVAGSGAVIEGNMENCSLIAKGETKVNGNIIGTSIEVGAFDSEKQNYLDNLNLFNRNIKELIDTIEEVKNHNILGHDKSDGEIIKVLIENKYRSIPKTCIEIIKYNILNNGSEDELVQQIKNKIVGLAPINIKYCTELNDIVYIADKRNKELGNETSIPVTLTVNYVQDSKVYSSGEIVVTGKGAYISEIVSKDKVVFRSVGSIIRGGVIKAENEIRAKVVGSTAGVKTILEVGKLGHIWIDTAYVNTKFIVGEREMILEESSRNVHVYLDEMNQMVIDKFKL